MRYFALFIISIFLSIEAYAFSISTFNIRNFDSNSPYSTDTTSLKKIIKNLDSDILVFQEIIDTQGLKYLINDTLKFRKTVFSTCGGFAKQKLALSYDSRKFKFLKSVEDNGFSKEVRCNQGVRPLFKVQLKYKETGTTFWTLITHFKAGATHRDTNFRKHQISLLNTTIKRLRNFIILGDFNTTRINSSEGKYFFDFIDENNLISSTKHIDCSSFWSGGISDGLYYPSRLDHILLSRSLGAKFYQRKFSAHSHCKKVQCRISTASELGTTFQNVSDHCPIKLELTRK
jgi:endonuclease/exonuclease/phosphatase family metal-dependent hydrolase